MTPRAVQLPYVAMPRDQEQVCIRFPIPPVGPDSEYYEMHLTPDEARSHGLAILVDAERAAYMIAVNRRIAESAAKRHSHVDARKV